MAEVEKALNGDRKKEKIQGITIELGCDNTSFMTALKEIEAEVDIITDKLEKLGKLTKELLK